MPIDWELSEMQEWIRSKHGSFYGFEDLNEYERLIEDMMYFESAALSNAGDIFDYVPWILEREEAFSKINANGTIQAAKGLQPHYDEYKFLDSGEDTEFFYQIRQERELAMEKVETIEELQSLVRAYGNRHADEIGDGPSV